MKLRKMISAVLVFGAALTWLTGCAEVPEEVQSGIDAEEQNTSADGKNGKTDASVKLEAVSKVLTETPESWKQKSGNAEFDGRVRVPEVSELYKWKVEIANEAFQNPEKVKEVYRKYFNNLEIKKEGDPGGGHGMWKHIQYEEKLDRELGEEEWPPYVDIMEDGYLTMIVDEWEDVGEYSPDNAKLEKVYLFDESGKCLDGGDEKWLVENRVEITAQEAMDQTRKLAEDYMKVEPDVTLVPDRVVIYHYKREDAYRMECWELLSYDGVRVDGSLLTQDAIKAYNNTCRLYTHAWKYTLGEGMNDFCVRHPYKAVEKLETYGEMLTLEDAWKLFVEKMAAKRKVKVTQADLMYSVWYHPEGDTGVAWYAELEEPPEMFATPVWRFEGEVDRAADDPRGNTCTVFVDAVTGEVMAY